MAGIPKQILMNSGWYPYALKCKLSEGAMNWMLPLTIVWLNRPKVKRGTLIMLQTETGYAGTSELGLKLPPLENDSYSSFNLRLFLAEIKL